MVNLALLFTSHCKPKLTAELRIKKIAMAVVVRFRVKLARLVTGSVGGYV